MSSDKKLKAQFEKNKRRSDLSDDDATLDGAINALIKEASLFHDSAHLQRARWLKIAWSIAAGLGVVAIMLAVAIVVLTPLKRTEPILITAYSDGRAEVIRDFSGDVSFEKEVDDYFLKEYVRQRETYDWNKIQYIVDFTKAWSAPHVYTEFYNVLTSESGVLSTLGQKARVDVQVTSSRVIKDQGVAVIRITKTPKLSDGSPLDKVMPTYWIAEVSYTMTGEQIHADREVNPFGYTVTSYTLTQDKTK